MSIEYIADHQERIRELLLQQFKNKPVFTSLMDALGRQFQDLEDAAQQLLTERTVDTAIGAQLDVIGVIVGERRQGLDDDRYRLRIRARILINASDGLTQEIIDVATLVILAEGVPAGFVVEVASVGDTTIHLTTDAGLSLANRELLCQFLAQTRAAGVALYFFFSAGGLDAFTYADGDVVQPGDLLLGYGDDPINVSGDGGQYADVLFC